MVVGMVVEAFKGAVEEVKAGPTAQEKARRAWGLTTTIVRELAGMLSGLPYAFHQMAVWRSPEKYQQRWRFNLLRNVRYGPAERNLLDVYTPMAPTCDEKSSLPVLMFVHGGVWASGDKFLFSTLGASLAHQGVIALLLQYSLYPQVLAKDQVKEVSRALTWALDNVGQYGGNPDKIHVMGHSSGAHVCAMLLWERAIRNLGFWKGASSEEVEDRRHPRCYLGLSGVYNIGEHYRYEKGRGVAAISCMKPAMGGLKGFSAMSPEILFGSLLALKCNQKLQPAEEDVLAGNLLSTVDTADMDWAKWASEQAPFVFFASDNDIVVPPLSSVKLHKVLQELGCRSGVSLHESLSHDDFVCWVKGIGGKDNPNAKVLINDVLDIVNNERKIANFLHSQVDVSN